MVLVESASPGSWTFSEFPILQHFSHIVFNMEKLPYDKLPVTINITSVGNNRPVTVYLLVPTPASGKCTLKLGSCLDIHPISTEEEDTVTLSELQHDEVIDWLDDLEVQFGELSLPQVSLAQIQSNCTCEKRGSSSRSVRDSTASRRTLRSGRTF